MNFYPANAAVPEATRTDRLWLRPLRATDAERDYEAVMVSKEQLHRIERHRTEAIRPVPLSR